MFGHMETNSVIASFSALAQETRLEAFRLLVRHEPEGLAAGEVARQLGVPHNTMSAHLAVLTRAGLAVSQRQSRSIIYRANLSQKLSGFWYATAAQATRKFAILSWLRLGSVLSKMMKTCLVLGRNNE